MAKRLIALLSLLLVLAAASLEAAIITDAAGRRVEVPDRVTRLPVMGDG